MSGKKEKGYPKNKISPLSGNFLQLLQPFIYLNLRLFDDLNKLLRLRNLFFLDIGVDRLDVVILLFDLVDLHKPAFLTDFISFFVRVQPVKEIIKLIEGHGALLQHLDIRHIIVPDLLGWLSFGEEEQVRLNTGPRVQEDVLGQTQDISISDYRDLPKTRRI